jgi:MFS family permease
MAFLCVLSFLTYYDRQCIVRAQESIQASLNLSDAQMGLIFGMFWLAYALFEIPGGWMGDRFGARFTTTRIVLAWSLFTMLTGAATGFLSLPVWRRRGGRFSEYGPDSIALAADRRTGSCWRHPVANGAVGRSLRSGNIWHHDAQHRLVAVEHK